MIFWLIFLIIPLIEVGLFIEAGARLGLGTTLVLCVLTAVIGSVFLRQQGLKALFSAREALNQGEMPLQEMFDGICLAVAGACLMTPGFFTDGIGFTLLVPVAREFLRGHISKYAQMKMYGNSSEEAPKRPSSRPPDVIEGDFERVERDGH